MSSTATSTPAPAELSRISRLIILDGLCSHVLGVLTTGAILVGFALHLGASNAVIGVISGIPFLAQMLQIPAVYVVNRMGHRRALVVGAGLIGRTFWLTLATIPWVVPEPWRVHALIALMVSFFSLNALVNCAWSSWMRDLVPDRSMGALFGRRMSIGTALAALLSLAAGYSIDRFTSLFAHPLAIYSVLFLLGGSFGLLGLLFLWRTPERPMQPVGGESMLRLLSAPLRDTNYRNLLVFLGVWSVAANLAAPFFTVYMLKQLQMSMTWVLAFSVVSQAVTVVFYRIWGRLSDRYTNKSVLGVAGFLFILTFLMWPFTTMPEKHSLTIPLLIFIHVVAGIGTAGVTLCTGNIALRAAPFGRATAYLAVNALITGFAATTAPVLAGSAADWLGQYQLQFDVRWISTTSPSDLVTLHALNLGGFDFLFIFAFIVGLYAMHRLLAVREEGEVKERVVLYELFMEVRRIALHVSNITGLRHFGYFPYILLRQRARPSARKGEDADDGRRSPIKSPEQELAEPAFETKGRSCDS
ncbi:MAG: MFS transporter [Candidatus Hydrogenedentes bacterium]|nr:MFS transporter [Candidatus Hydrogenedentota bacterium]